MTGKPFAVREPRPQNFFARLLGLRNVDAMAAEVESALADRWPASLPSRADISAIEDKHGIKFAARGLVAARAILQRAAAAVTSELPLKVPAQTVTDLADALGVPSNEASAAVKSAGRELLRREVQRALADRKISAEERDGFHAAAKAVGLTSDDVAEAIVEQITPLYRKHIDAALSDGKLSPDEERSLSKLAQDLGLNPTYDKNLQASIDRARELWTITDGPLPNVAPPFLLQKNEQCVFAINAEVFEKRTRTTAYRYGGTSTSVTIIKGFRLRSGRTRVHRETEEYHHSFGKGPFCLTNKRLIWKGASKSVAIALTKIIDFEPYTDGVLVEKDTGKPLLVVFSNEDRNFGPLFSRVLAESRK